jgi:hypothetical protein
VTILLIVGFAAQCSALQCADELEVLQDNLSDKTLALAGCLREANVLRQQLQQQVRARSNPSFAMSRWMAS